MPQNFRAGKGRAPAEPKLENVRPKHQEIPWYRFYSVTFFQIFFLKKHVWTFLKPIFLELTRAEKHENEVCFGKKHREVLHNKGS